MDIGASRSIDIVAVGAGTVVGNEKDVTRRQDSVLLLGVGNPRS